MNTAWLLVIGVPLAGMILILWPCVLVAAQSDLRMEEFREELVRKRTKSDLHN
ncbi:MAG: hypothetical protein HOP33_02715 [Verrucomicrobia bacterium]|nr:hypothetical protein [Verrucomicrobiota bacterium]